MIADITGKRSDDPIPTSLEALFAQLTDENHQLRTRLCLFGKLVDENMELRAEVQRLKQHLSPPICEML